MQQVMERSMKRFGDQLYIRHTPVLAQEALAKVVLISAGYVHRQQPMFLFTIARSSLNTAGISHRLASTSSRARLLGMVVGSAISALIDKPGSRLNFGVDELNSEDAQTYLDLVHIQDHIGNESEMAAFLKAQFSTEQGPASVQGASSKKRESLKPKADSMLRAEQTEQAHASAPSSSKIQLLDDDEDDDDLVPYPKPDSDPEDDDEDATLVNRNRPSAPVYIRDLITFLKDSENYDRHVLALRTAPSLIRRKANFGNEVKDHIVELANLFVGLTDQFDLEDFAALRLQTLVAILVAQPREMGRWFAKAFFEGDYSISQRAATLSAMGLGARELAGQENDEDLAGPAQQMNEMFPSKKLPEKFHKLYGGKQDPIDRETRRLERVMMQPLALNAADKLSGPNALKVRTFSSRMEVEKKKKKATSNELGNIVADGFFFPLTGRFQMTLQTS
jgi:telomere length regulation protein